MPLSSVTSVDLGPVNLSAPGSMTYIVTDLPRDEFTVGLQITAADTSVVVKESGPLDTIIALKMLNEDGVVIVEERGTLRTWRWAHRYPMKHQAFLHRRGERKRSPLSRASTRTGFSM